MGNRGNSFLELIILLGLMGVLGALAGESLVTAAARQQSRAVVAEFAAELRGARQMAILRREGVRVRLNPGATALVVEQAEAAGAILRRYELGGKGVVIAGAVTGKGIVFYPSGRTATPGTVTIRNTREEEWRIAVSLIGRVSVK